MALLVAISILTTILKGINLISLLFIFYIPNNIEIYFVLCISMQRSSGSSSSEAKGIGNDLLTLVVGRLLLLCNKSFSLLLLF